MLKEAIILAGGLGTRLRSAVPELPKCLAPVAGKPFLSYVIDYFSARGIERFIFALGYKSELFDDFLHAKLSPSDYAVSTEAEPLGTGGAIKLACGKTSGNTVLILNGDTFFRVHPDEMAIFHAENKSTCTLALKPMSDFDRYGVVRLNADGSVKHFEEKKHYAAGLINGGVYALETAPFLGLQLPEKFSFEKDYLENPSQGQRFYGLVQDDYFIDIGIPEDYERAQREIRAMAGTNE